MTLDLILRVCLHVLHINVNSDALELSIEELMIIPDIFIIFETCSESISLIDILVSFESNINWHWGNIAGASSFVKYMFLLANSVIALSNSGIVSFGFSNNL